MSIAPVGGGGPYAPVGQPGQPNPGKSPPLGPGGLTNRGKRVPHVGSALRAGQHPFAPVRNTNRGKRFSAAAEFWAFLCRGRVFACFFFAVFGVFFLCCFLLRVFFHAVNDILVLN